MNLNRHHVNMLLATLVLPVLLVGTANAQDPSLLPSFDRTSYQTETYEKELTRNDSTSSEGKHIDVYNFEAQPQQVIEVELSSEDFDPYLWVIAPDGIGHSNDDYQGWNSRVELVTEVGGTWTVRATSYNAGTTGAYVLTIALGPVAIRNQTFEGTLDEGDKVTPKGLYYDMYSIPLEEGELVKVEVNSSFLSHPELALIDPNGRVRTIGSEFGNLDKVKAKDQRDHNVIGLQVTKGGDWTIVITALSPDDLGSYRLLVRIYSGEGVKLPQVIEGTLDTKDEQFFSGEYYDTYDSENLEPGQRLVVDLTSSDFDTFLSISSPSGESHTNDDYPTSRGYRSRLVIFIREAGRAVIFVTSFEPGTVGKYRLTLTVEN